MKDKLYYVTPAWRILSLRGESNFLATGDGENADPKDGSWLYDEFDF